MHETQQPTKEIIADILSGDSHRVWSASCGILSLSQNHDRIKEIAHYKFRIKFATKRILTGWPYSIERRRLLKIFEIIEFHKKNKGCPCCLLGQEDNPHHVVEDGYFDLLQTVPRSPICSVNDYYILRCRRCGVVYKVSEREYHFLWWDWNESNPIDFHCIYTVFDYHMSLRTPNHSQRLFIDIGLHSVSIFKTLRFALRQKANFIPVHLRCNPL